MAGNLTIRGGIMRYFAAILPILLPTATGKAEVVFTQPTVELGSLRTGRFFDQTFSYVNRGTGAVELTEVKASCGCLQPEFRPGTLAAGQTGTLKIKINTLSASPGQE